jgi:hypothetical protein
MGKQLRMELVMEKTWVLLDDEGNVVRYFDYPAKGAVELIKLVEPKLTFDEMLDKFGEALL